jgi:MoaA/NifB/PqqE/SkfB family radical SAM enzyme
LINQEKIFRNVYFEVSGFCQARCPHCCTGNRSLTNQPSRFIPVDDFKKAVRYLFDAGLIDKDTRFDPYNWGEPFLNPQLSEVLKVLSDNGLKFRISTNGGKYKKLASDVTKNLTRMTITIPGFSQSSYDRVHGLDFKSVLDNINKFAEDLGPSRLWITYLVHQFNVDEIPETYKYFIKLGTRFNLTVAYLNDYSLSRDFLTGSLSKERLMRMGRDLFLFYVEEIIRARPQNYLCPQFSILALDEFCNVLTCCLVSKNHSDYSIGSLFNLSSDEIREGKLSRPVCRECGQLGIDYWVQTVPDLFFLKRITGEGIPISELVEILKGKIRNKVLDWFGRR